jgi:hypothetical protein
MYRSTYSSLQHLLEVSDMICTVQECQNNRHATSIIFKMSRKEPWRLRSEKFFIINPSCDSNMRYVKEVHYTTGRCALIHRATDVSVLCSVAIRKRSDELEGGQLYLQEVRRLLLFSKLQMQTTNMWSTWQVNTYRKMYSCPYYN